MSFSCINCSLQSTESFLNRTSGVEPSPFSEQEDEVKSRASLIVFVISIIVTLSLVMLAFMLPGISSSTQIFLLSSAGGIGVVSLVSLIFHLYINYCRLSKKKLEQPQPASPLPKFIKPPVPESKLFLSLLTEKEQAGLDLLSQKDFTQKTEIEQFLNFLSLVFSDFYYSKWTIEQKKQIQHGLSEVKNYLASQDYEEEVDVIIGWKEKLEQVLVCTIQLKEIAIIFDKNFRKGLRILRRKDPVRWQKVKDLERQMHQIRKKDVQIAFDKKRKILSALEMLKNELLSEQEDLIEKAVNHVDSCFKMFVKDCPIFLIVTTNTLNRVMQAVSAIEDRLEFQDVGEEQKEDLNAWALLCERLYEKEVTTTLEKQERIRVVLDNSLKAIEKAVEDMILREDNPLIQNVIANFYEALEKEEIACISITSKDLELVWEGSFSQVLSKYAHLDEYVLVNQTIDMFCGLQNAVFITLQQKKSLLEKVQEMKQVVYAKQLHEIRKKTKECKDIMRSMQLPLICYKDLQTFCTSSVVYWIRENVAQRLVKQLDVLICKLKVLVKWSTDMTTISQKAILDALERVKKEKASEEALNALEETIEDARKEAQISVITSEEITPIYSEKTIEKSVKDKIDKLVERIILCFSIGQVKITHFKREEIFEIIEDVIDSCSENNHTAVKEFITDLEQELKELENSVKDFINFFDITDEEFCIACGGQQLTNNLSKLNDIRSTLCEQLQNSIDKVQQITKITKVSRNCKKGLLLNLHQINSILSMKLEQMDLEKLKGLSRYLVRFIDQYEDFDSSDYDQISNSSDYDQTSDSRD